MGENPLKRPAKIGTQCEVSYAASHCYLVRSWHRYFIMGLMLSDGRNGYISRCAFSCDMRKGACVPSASPLRAAGGTPENARPEPELSRKSRTRPACSAAVQSGFGTCIIPHGKASSAALVSWCVPFLSKRRTNEERKGGEL